MSSQPAPALRYLLVLDFEATCGNNIKQESQEIIEFPTLLYDLQEDKVEATFHEYVRPIRHQTLTGFCTDLTGITQETVDAADPFPTVWSRYLAFLKEHGATDDPASYAFLTCGDWDLKTMLPRQLAREALMAQQAAEESDATPDAASDMTITSPLDRWINIKNAFRDHYKKVKGKRATGMEGMLAVLGMQLEGKHHSGIDDCRNILRIVQRMRNDGWKPEDEPIISHSII